MASYTMQLRTYIETWTQTDKTKTTAQRIEAGRVKLFDFDYPIFDPLYKNVLETHIIRHFYMREIGFENEGLFKFNLETWMIVNMPYFNKLFESELLVFDPLKNSEMQSTYNKTNDANNSQTSTHTGTNTSSGNNFERDLESNNPDSRLSITPNADGSGTIEYASKINEHLATTGGTSNDTSNGSSTGIINSTEDYIQHRAGKIGVQTYSKMLVEYRDSFIRIENMIFKEMQQLFMLVY